MYARVVLWVKVRLVLLTVFAGNHGWEVAGAMEVDVAIERVATQCVKVFGVLLGDMAVAIRLANYRFILTLSDLSVTIALANAALKKA